MCKIGYNHAAVSLPYRRSQATYCRLPPQPHLHRCRGQLAACACHAACPCLAWAAQHVCKGLISAMHPLLQRPAVSSSLRSNRRPLVPAMQPASPWAGKAAHRDSPASKVRCVLQLRAAGQAAASPCCRYGRHVACAWSQPVQVCAEAPGLPEASPPPHRHRLMLHL